MQLYGLEYFYLILIIYKQLFGPFNCVKIELLLDSNTWNHLTAYRHMISGSFKDNVTSKLIHIIYI